MLRTSLNKNCVATVAWSCRRASLHQSAVRAKDPYDLDLDLDEEDPMESSKSLHGFDSRRRDPFGATNESRPATTTEKERMIFANLVDSLLSQKSAGTYDTEPKNNKQGGSMSQSLHALFERAFNASSPNTGPSSSSNIDVTTDDLRKNLPLSYGSLTTKSRLDVLGGSDREEKERYGRLLKPVLDYVDGLETDVAVVKFYISKVLDRYNEDNELESLDESFQIDVEQPPLVRAGLSLYLVKCMTILVQTFNDPVEALSLFELSKKNGISYYASTCTTDVYNKALEIKWNYYRDLYSVDSLLLEMQVNAVMGDKRTVDILNDIARQTIDAKHNVSGLENMPLWSREDDRIIDKIGTYRLNIMSNLASRERLGIL